MTFEESRARISALGQGWRAPYSSEVYRLFNCPREIFLTEYGEVHVHAPGTNLLKFEILFYDTIPAPDGWFDLAIRAPLDKDILELFYSPVLPQRLGESFSFSKVFAFPLDKSFFGTVVFH